MILLIDNYDSFSYNVYQLIGSFDKDIVVVRNDELSVQEIQKLNPKLIVLSPGPGKPEDAGVCPDVIRHLGKNIPIFGVCLGHQAICEVFGATVSHAPMMMHGKTSLVQVDNTSVLFQNLPNEIQVARYHSLIAIKESMPDCLKITALTKDDEIMAVEHKEYPIYGVQFHPESIMTPLGPQIVQNIMRRIHD